MVKKKKKITREIRKYLKLDENKSTKYQNIWDTPLAVANGSDKQPETWKKHSWRIGDTNDGYTLRVFVL